MKLKESDWYLMIELYTPEARGTLKCVIYLWRENKYAVFQL
jgi:hypothetical protein